MYGLPRHLALRRLKLKNDSLDFSVQKKTFAPWCIRNRFAFLYNHCKNNSRTFLLPRELVWQKRLAKNIDDLHKERNKMNTIFSFTVRVLLQEQEISSSHNETWHIKSLGGFKIQSYDQPHQKLFLPQKNINIHCFAQGIYINNNRCPFEKILIYPAKGFLEFNRYHYQGAFLVALENNQSYLISQLDIEDYIYSVLRWESWPGWPMEVNKAFAIACRSYLIAKVLESCKSQKLYHIKNTNIHQTYNGVHEYVNLKRAIEATRGLILSHKKKPIDAMFDSCCGGVIPAQLSGVNFKKSPYLARTYPCTFCKPCKIYAWRLEYSLQDFKEILTMAGRHIDEVHDIKIVKKDRAGAAQEIVIKDKHKNHIFTGKQFYSLFTKIKSFCYTIEKNATHVCFNGKGYGHHLGICQWGARRMIDAGFNYQSILQFYYPGARLMELKNTV